MIHRAPKPPAREKSKPHPISRIGEKKLAALGDKPLPFSTITGKRKAVQPRNARRRRSEFSRAYGSHAEYIRSLPCCVCGHQGHTVAAHTTTGGMGRKADAETLAPMCSARRQWVRSTGLTTVEGCHEESHRIGVKTFEEKYSTDLKAWAAALWTGRAV